MYVHTHEICVHVLYVNIIFVHTYLPYDEAIHQRVLVCSNRNCLLQCSENNCNEVQVCFVECLDN